MKCPLFVMGQLANTIPAVGSNSDCLKEECAWWEANDGQCSVKVIAQFIAGIGMNIKDIRDKMPHEEQFRR